MKRSKEIREIISHYEDQKVRWSRALDKLLHANNERIKKLNRELEAIRSGEKKDKEI